MNDQRVQQLGYYLQRELTDLLGRLDYPYGSLIIYLNETEYITLYFGPNIREYRLEVRMATKAKHNIVKTFKNSYDDPTISLLKDGPFTLLLTDNYINVDKIAKLFRTLTDMGTWLAQFTIRIINSSEVGRAKATVYDKWGQESLIDLTVLNNLVKDLASYKVHLLTNQSIIERRADIQEYFVERGWTFKDKNMDLSTFNKRWTHKHIFEHVIKRAFDLSDKESFYDRLVDTHIKQNTLEHVVDVLDNHQKYCELIDDRASHAILLDKVLTSYVFSVSLLTSKSKK